MPCSLAGGAGVFVKNPHNSLNPQTVKKEDNKYNKYNIIS